MMLFLTTQHQSKEEKTLTGSFLKNQSIYLFIYLLVTFWPRYYAKLMPLVSSILLIFSVFYRVVK